MLEITISYRTDLEEEYFLFLMMCIVHKSNSILLNTESGGEGTLRAKICLNQHCGGHIYDKDMCLIIHICCLMKFVLSDKDFKQYTALVSIKQYCKMIKPDKRPDEVHLLFSK